jgi:hypothetical protein
MVIGTSLLAVHAYRANARASVPRCNKNDLREEHTPTERKHTLASCRTDQADKCVVHGLSKMTYQKRLRQKEFHRYQSCLSGKFIVVSKVAEGISPIPYPFEQSIYRCFKGSLSIGSLPSHERCSVPLCGQHCAQAAMARGGQHFPVMEILHPSVSYRLV